MTHAISPAGLALIQEFEGFRATPAQLPDGNWVVGHGHVRSEAGAPVTEAQAADLLEADIAPFEAAINALVQLEITQSQFDALVSLALSIGVDAFAQSQVLRRVNSGAFTAAAGAMDAWRKAEVDGEIVVIDALVRRRAAEKALFLKDTPLAAAPSVLVRAKLDYAALVLGAPMDYAASPGVDAPRAKAVAAPVAVAPVQRLTEILKSEPATELLLTQIAPAEAVDEEGEIVTAHAKPAARQIASISSMPRDRRIARLRERARFNEGVSNFISNLSLGQSMESFGLAALFLFGVGLTFAGGSMLYASQGELFQIVGGAALSLPGLIAMLMAGLGFVRGPQPSAVKA